MTSRQSLHSLVKLSWAELSWISASFNPPENKKGILIPRIPLLSAICCQPSNSTSTSHQHVSSQIRRKHPSPPQRRIPRPLIKRHPRPLPHHQLPCKPRLRLTRRPQRPRRRDESGHERNRRQHHPPTTAHIRRVSPTSRRPTDGLLGIHPQSIRLHISNVRVTRQGTGRFEWSGVFESGWAGPTWCGGARRLHVAAGFCARRWSLQARRSRRGHAGFCARWQRSHHRRLGEVPNPAHRPTEARESEIGIWAGAKFNGACRGGFPPEDIRRSLSRLEGPCVLHGCHIRRREVADQRRMEEAVVVACGNHRIGVAGTGDEEGRWKHWPEGLVLTNAMSTISWGFTGAGLGLGFVWYIWYIKPAFISLRSTSSGSLLPSELYKWQYRSRSQSGLIVVLASSLVWKVSWILQGRGPPTCYQASEPCVLLHGRRLLPVRLLGSNQLRLVGRYVAFPHSAWTEKWVRRK